MHYSVQIFTWSPRRIAAATITTDAISGQMERRREYSAAHPIASGYQRWSSISNNSLATNTV